MHPLEPRDIVTQSPLSTVKSGKHGWLDRDLKLHQMSLVDEPVVQPSQTRRVVWELLQACYQYGQVHPKSPLNDLIRYQITGQLSQEDATEFCFALSDVLKLEEHDQCTLRSASQYTYREGGKSYTYQRDPELPEFTMRVQLREEADKGSMNLQGCLDLQSQPELGNSEWSTAEAKKAGYHRPGKLGDGKKHPTERTHALVADDVSRLSSHTMMLGQFECYWDKEQGKLTQYKLTDRVKKVFNDVPLHLKRDVYDLKTQSMHSVPMELQSIVVHSGSTPSGGHYTTLVRSREGDWVLFNDQEVVRVDDVKRYLNNDLYSRTAYQLNYVVGRQATDSASGGS